MGTSPLVLGPRLAPRFCHSNATLGQPGGLTVDAQGNLYISDVGNGVVRMVDTNGVITTVIGG